MRLRLLTLVAAGAAALTLAACGDDGTAARDRDTAVAQRLAQPGRTWATLKPSEQQEALAACRLQRAVDLARESGATSAPYFSSRFTKVMRLPGDALHHDLTRRFRQDAHADEPIADGCRAVVDEHVDPAALRRAPHADFASPVTVRRDVLTLNVDGDRALLRARVAPAGARLTLGDAPRRARTTARWTTTERDGVTRVDLRHIPRGTSYLEVRVGDWRRVLVIHGARASRFPPPRTFAPIRLHGQGQVGLPVLYVPQPAVLTTDVHDAPLALTSGTTLLVAVSGRDDGRVPLRPGRYRDVRVRTPGAWSIRVAPTR